MTWVALLRGINVGGHNVAMADLRSHFDDLGFINVRSFIQTGNVFFESDETNPVVLEKQIAGYLEGVLGYAVPVCLRTLDELEASLTTSPFAGMTPAADERYLVLFSNGPLPAGTSLPLLSPKGDNEIIGSRASDVYVIVRLVNGKFPSSNFVEKQFGLVTTGRFYHTALKILAAAKA